MPENIIYYNNPLLKCKCEPITKIDYDIVQFSKNLTELMIKHDGIGLAANQVGVCKQIISIAGIEPFKEPIILINPKIIEYKDPVVTYEEGCLSFPRLYLNVDRPEGVIVEYFDLSMKKITIEAHELLARVLQHEIDHLNGISFIDRISTTKRNNIESVLENINRKFNG
ncbi:MAG TPA: peptide deformylase [Exilispira sp.]|nr:peptide deformylase [Exilispira sp.]HNV44683.1 peptide deformylase [Exilispira sp.]HPB47654.1 peptide deformylase [Exilispira sp.]HQJ41433.1 peptide deformylase [Exilispira sp.]HQM88589.1 peptide deformylase [Exilispira sp.]